jgi:hypothetical protein
MLFYITSPPSTIQHDISVYPKDEFARIRDDHQYLLVTDQSLAPDWPGAHKLRRDFRDIVGSIVLLANLLSTLSLAKLLHIEKTDIDDQLRCLHSVLGFPPILTRRFTYSISSFGNS